MKKIFSVIFILIFVLSSFCSCGNEKKQKENSTSQTTTLTETTNTEKVEDTGLSKAREFVGKTIGELEAAGFESFGRLFMYGKYTGYYSKDGENYDVIIFLSTEETTQYWEIRSIPNEEESEERIQEFVRSLVIYNILKA